MPGEGQYSTNLSIINKWYRLATNPIWIVEIRTRVASSVSSKHNRTTCSLPNNPVRYKHVPEKPEAKNKNMSNKRGTSKARKDTVVRVTLMHENRNRHSHDANFLRQLTAECKRHACVHSHRVQTGTWAHIRLNSARRRQQAGVHNLHTTMHTPLSQCRETPEMKCMPY